MMMLLLAVFVMLMLGCPHVAAFTSKMTGTKVFMVNSRRFNAESSAEPETSVGSDAAEPVLEKPTECGPCPMAPKCKGDYLEQGCDGTGKIQGGIATVPLLSWWPIKVYRPCPAYLQAGYQYRREGQTMDQVLFSEPSEKMKQKIAARKREELEQELAAEKERAERSVDLSTAEQLLEEKFGKNKKE